MMATKYELYIRGVPGRKYGIYNLSAKCFQFGICEDTPMLAEARLHQKIGNDAKKWRFEVRELPDNMNQMSCNGCRWKSLGRYQRCTSCRRNADNLKDNYE